MNQRPDLTITAERELEQPGPLGRMAMRASLGVSGDVWLATIRCPHGEVKLHFVVPDAEPGAPKRSDAELVESNVAMIRHDFPSKADCPCGHPYWMRHGPILATLVPGETPTIDFRQQPQHLN